MKYIKEYIDFEEDWEEFENDIDISVGDYITLERLGKYNGDVLIITKIEPNDDWDYWVSHYPSSFSGGEFGYSVYKNEFRKSTSDEINNFKLDFRFGNINKR